ncbi:MAG: hypothetical protein H8K04_03075 [Nitrospira sp.]
MTLIIAGKSDVIPPMAMKVALSLCMAAMIAGCSSGTMVNMSEDKKDDEPCLTQEQKLAKVKELKEKDSGFKSFAESKIVRGGGNLLGSMVGLGNAGEYADMANDVKKMTVKGNAARDSIDTIRTKDCDSEHDSAIGASAVK